MLALVLQRPVNGEIAGMAKKRSWRRRKIVIFSFSVNFFPQRTRHARKERIMLEANRLFYAFSICERLIIKSTVHCWSMTYFTVSKIRDFRECTVSFPSCRKREPWERRWNIALNHKNYDFLNCDWFKKLLFPTNSLAKLLSDSLLSDSSTNQSHSKL